ncbi:amidohydrolase family protein [Nocardia sp. NPDC057030]|uniref:amidohydrolase family protein n=1 Tax=unclassified Nocardia TaxID=2637762 RepID=UPI00362F3E61
MAFERADDLPQRQTLLIRGGLVVAMDDDEPRPADILIEDGVIVEIGSELSCASAFSIDAEDHLVLPGFIDTHWHLWNSLLRGTVGSAPGHDYFSVKRALAPHHDVDDFYWAARFGLAEAVDAGFTTVHNWDHNVRDIDDVDANIAAHLDAGLRGRFSYGPRDHSGEGELMDLAGMRSMLERWTPELLDNRITFGVALRGPYRTTSEVYIAEWKAARDAGLPITMHCDRCLREPNCNHCGLTRLADEGLLGPDVQIVHAVHASGEDIESLARSGTTVSLSPVTELQTMGFPLVSELLAAGVAVSFSIDTLAMPTTADVFTALRTVLSVEKARTQSDDVTARQLLRMATIDAAACLGIGDTTGSISVGKRADVIVIGHDVNLLPTGDPFDSLVYNGRTDNIRTVVADGRVLKRDGDLTQASASNVGLIAQSRRDHIVARARAAGDWQY